MPYTINLNASTLAPQIRRIIPKVRDRLRLAVLSSVLYPEVQGSLPVPFKAQRDEAQRRARAELTGFMSSTSPEIRAAAQRVSAGSHFVLSPRSAGAGPAARPVVRGSTTANQAPAVHCEAEFLLRKIKCVERTHRAVEIENGLDEIYLIGLLVDLGTGQTKKVSMDLGQFSNGKVVAYDPSVKVGSVKLSGGPMPACAGAVLFLCENDPGAGMNEFLEALYDKAVHEVETELESDETGENQNDSQDEAGSDEPPPWWVLVLQVIAMIVTELFSYLRQDDVFYNDPIKLTSRVWNGGIDVSPAIASDARVTQYKADYRLEFSSRLKCHT